MNLTIHLASTIVPADFKLEVQIVEICRKLKFLQRKLNDALTDDVQTTIEHGLAIHGRLQPIRRWGSTSSTWHAAASVLADSLLTTFLLDFDVPVSIEAELIDTKVSARQRDKIAYYVKLRKSLRGFDTPDDDVDATIRQEHAFAIACLQVNQIHPDNPAPPDLPRRARIAGEQYRQATEALGSEPTDREVYDQLAKAMKQAGELAELPTFQTWQRNLREYRRLAGQQKRQPRAGRTKGKGTVVKPEQLEPQQLPTRIRPRFNN